MSRLFQRLSIFQGRKAFLEISNPQIVNCRRKYMVNIASITYKRYNYNNHRYFCSSSESNKSSIDPQTTTTTTTTPTQLPGQHVQQSVQRAFRRWQRWFTIRIMIFITLIIGIFAYCWDHPNQVYNLKNKISKIFSEVGTSTLNNDELQQQATQYSKQMLTDIFNDESMQNSTKKFLIQILSQQDFLDTVSILLRDLFSTDVMIESVQELVINVFNDPSVIEQCKKLVGHAISSQENKELLLNVLNEILDDKELNDHAREVANDTIKHVLNDEDIKLLSATFLQHVLNDDSVQQTSSDSIYKIFVGAFTPNMFKRRKKKEQDSEKEVDIIHDNDHVPHQHFEMNEIVTQTQLDEVDNVDTVDNIDDVHEQVNHIESVVGHN